MYLTNNRWHKIYNVPKGDYFILNGKRHYLSDFVKCHNNPWVGDVYPEYIHAYYAHEYYNPIFIELSVTGDAVKIYLKEEK